jgi:hypothetical protein
VAPAHLLDDVRGLILQAREATAQAVNSALVLLYWQIGQRIRTEVLREKRADYGEQIVPTLSAQLTAEFGRGFAEKNLRRMVQFAEVFPDRQIVVTLSRQLGWSHFVVIIPLKNDLQRDFYAEMCRIERWSVRTLRGKVQSMLFERTALSRKPAELARQELEALREKDRLTPDLVFRDPTSSTSSVWPTATARRTSKPASSASCSGSSSSWAAASPSSTGKNVSSSTGRTTTSICSFITAGCGVSS